MLYRIHKHHILCNKGRFEVVARVTYGALRLNCKGRRYRCSNASAFRTGKHRQYWKNNKKHLYYLVWDLKVSGGIGGWGGAILFSSMRRTYLFCQ